MIHILFSAKKNKKTRKLETRFIEVNDSNGKILGDSSESHPSRERTFSNIVSKMKLYNSPRVSVVDHTTNDTRGWVKTYDIIKTITVKGPKYIKTNIVMTPCRRSWKKFEK